MRELRPRSRAISGEIHHNQAGHHRLSGKRRHFATVNLLKADSKGVAEREARLVEGAADLVEGSAVIKDTERNSLKLSFDRLFGTGKKLKGWRKAPDDRHIA